MQKLKNFFSHLWLSILHHKFWVSYYCFSFAFRLMYRAIIHDLSKLRPCELKGFVKSIHLLSKSTYGSDEYFAALKDIEGPIHEHYKANRHHPEHFFFDEESTPESIKEEVNLSKMDLIDLVEMYCDWEAAVRKHKDGDLSKSLGTNKKRFKISDDLHQIMVNTLKKL